MEWELLGFFRPTLTGLEISLTRVISLQAP
jgi:hypothetical protein